MENFEPYQEDGLIIKDYHEVIEPPMRNLIIRYYRQNYNWLTHEEDTTILREYKERIEELGDEAGFHIDDILMFGEGEA